MLHGGWATHHDNNGLAWQYDSFGNMLSQTVTGGLGTQTEWSYSAATNQPDQGCWDAAGNMLGMVLFLRLSMTRIGKLGTSALLLLLCVMPAMSCVMSPQATSAERTCCRMMMMGGDCGSMGTAAGHSCCKKVPSTANDALLTKASRHHEFMATSETISAFALAQPIPVGRLIERSESPPPISPPGFVTVLRI